MGNDSEWNPRTVTLGDTGESICDVFAKGVIGQEYMAWLKEHMRDGPPKVKANGAAKPTAPERLPDPPERLPDNLPGVAWHSEVPASNVTPIRKPEPLIDDDVDTVPPEFSEDGLAEAFTARYKDTMLYCGPARSWYAWDGGKWIKDETGLAVHKARQICKLMSDEVMARLELGARKEKIAGAISTRRVFSNVEAIARTDRRHVVLPTKFDSRLWLLNTPGGVVDLKTGQLRPARKEDFCTLQTRVAPDGRMLCPRWLQFLEEATDGDAELQLYLQRIAGYFLTGSVNEHCFFFCWGEGGGGKGTYINTLDWILNSYSKVAPMDTFLETRQSRHPQELAFMKGARLVTAQELDPGSKWNEARLKTLTGGDPITAREMYESSFTFYPTFKLLFSGNNKPILKNVDAAMRRRMYLIPFEHKVPDEKRDGNLQDYLKQAEAPGILQWMIEGCLDWQRNTLRPPERVMLATGEYFEEEDRIGAFFVECCEVGPGLRELTTVLYNRYRDWCDRNGEFPVSRKRFLASIAQKGYRSQSLGGSMCVVGVQVLGGV